MKQLIIIFLLFCGITSASLHGKCVVPYGEQAIPSFENYSNQDYTISVSNETIIISSLKIGSQIWVFDSSGRNIYNRITKSDCVTVPIRSRGIFIIRIKTDNEISTTKVLIK